MAKRACNPQREQFWRDVLARFRSSGLSVRVFCRQERLSEPSFYAWRRTIQQREAGPAAVRQRSTARRPLRPAFVPVLVHRDPLAPPGAGISLELRSGCTLRLPESISVERLAAIVQALERTEVGIMIGPRQGATAAQVWIATAPVDMRKSFDGLAEVVRAFLGHDPLSGNLFVFRNKSSERLKILWWDRDGLAIYYKRLERGAFRFPTSHDQAIAIDREQLLRLLDGWEVVTRSAS